MSNIKCKCSAMAVWCYDPGRSDNYYCDNCVCRGCSCMYDENDIPKLDERGRLLPCIEYSFNINGFYKIDTMEEHMQAEEYLKELWNKNDGDDMDGGEFDYIHFLMEEFIKIRKDG